MQNGAMSRLPRHLILLAALALIVPACRPTDPRPIIEPPTATPLVIVVQVTRAPTPTSPAPAVTDEPALRPRVLARQFTPISAFALAPDGQMLAIAEADRLSVLAASTLDQVWSMRTGDPVQALAFSPAGGLLAAGSEGGTIQVYDARRGDTLRVIDAGYGAITALAWSPDSSRIITGAEEALVLWNVLEARQVYGFSEQPGEYTGLSFAPASDHEFVAALNTGEIIVWNYRTGTPPNRLGTFREAVQAVAWSPDGRWIATGMESGRIILWDDRTGEADHYLDGPRFGGPALAWSTDSTTLVSGGSEGAVVIWDHGRGGRIETLTAPDDSPVIGVGLTPLGMVADTPRRVISASASGAVMVWPLGGDTP